MVVKNGDESSHGIESRKKHQHLNKVFQILTAWWLNQTPWKM